MAERDETDAWLRELRVDDAARRREARHDLAAVMGEAATMLDIARQWAAEGNDLLIAVAGTELTGTLRRIGPDWLELESQATGHWVAADAITWLRAMPAGDPSTSRSVDRSEVGLDEQLRLRSGQGETVTLMLRDGSRLIGRLDSVGAGTVVLNQPAAEGPVRVAVSLQSLGLVSG